MKKVLIIEDNMAIRDNIQEILELAGYEVFEAADGKSGIELALKNVPDIILCDIMMPEMDGYGVLYMLRKHIETSAVPFIFLTAKAEHLDLRKGMDLGADDYLTKPFDGMELLNSIESRLKKKDGQQNFYSRSLDRLQNLVAKSDGLSELKKTITERRNRVFKKNQVIYYDGDPGNGLYLIISGKVKTIKLDKDGRELMTGIHTTDDYLGINGGLSNEAYTDTATALEDCIICHIPKVQLEELLNLYPVISREFIKILANDIREKEELLMQLAYHSVRKKMAEALLRLYRGNNELPEFNAAREDLAAMAGMASETVSRTLSDFKEEGLIAKKGNTVTILSPDRLTKMKN
ncbi:MAG: response regulator [Ferruginibacter sp.]